MNKEVELHSLIKQRLMTVRSLRKLTIRLVRLWRAGKIKWQRPQWHLKGTLFSPAGRLINTVYIIIISSGNMAPIYSRICAAVAGGQEEGWKYGTLYVYRPTKSIGTLAKVRFTLGLLSLTWPRKQIWIKRVRMYSKGTSNKRAPRGSSPQRQNELHYSQGHLSSRKQWLDLRINLQHGSYVNRRSRGTT